MLPLVILGVMACMATMQGGREEVNGNGFQADQVTPILFPGTDESSSESSFEDAWMAAAETGRPLHLMQDLQLQDTIVLRKRQQLTIYAATTEPITISGSLHSLFLLNGHSRLILENIHLHHTLESDDHRKVGAAVNLRYKASLSISNSRIKSRSGFCCWAVQKATIELVRCDLLAPIRSPVVCFGQATCRLTHCTISNAGVHAVCARGACHIYLDHCTISKSVARAVYAYANASVTLTHCSISGTIRPDKAAIEVSAAGGGVDGSSSSLTMRDCNVVDNAGVGVRLRGPINFVLEEGNVVERNAGGDIDRTECLEEDNEDNGGDILRRDAAGSSFRRGDWWCPKCTAPRRVNVDRFAVCPQCQSEKIEGRLLTVEEIHQCNRGVLAPASANVNREPSSWWFDGEEGWLRYDEESSKQLEEAYQRYLAGCAQEETVHLNSPEVFLSGGKYQVDIKTMEQINVESHFLRLVRRRESKCVQSP